MCVADLRSLSGGHEAYILLWCDALWSGGCLPTFWRKVLSHLHGRRVNQKNKQQKQADRIKHLFPSAYKKFHVEVSDVFSFFPCNGSPPRLPLPVTWRCTLASRFPIVNISREFSCLNFHIYVYTEEVRPSAKLLFLLILECVGGTRMWPCMM